MSRWKFVCLHIPLFCLFILVFLLLSLEKIHCFDIWWHLATGKWIWTHKAIPSQDVFSFTQEGDPWIDFTWGFQALIYPIYKVSGLSGIILFKTLKSPYQKFTFMLMEKKIIKRPFFYFEKSLKSNPYYKNFQLEKAIKYFRRAVLIAKDREKEKKNYYNLGNCYFGLGMYEKAIEYYKKSLKIDPKFEKAKYNLKKAIEKVCHKQRD